METDAEFSSCRTYRYALWRWWDRTKPYAMFIGLNPSTADETEDDPTVRRCIRFARDWGYGGLCMTNLFALRATDPKLMKAHEFPVGPDNTQWINNLAAFAGVVVFAWGLHGVYQERDTVVTEILGKGMCLGRTKDGHPRHPLYVKTDTPLEKYL